MAHFLRVFRKRLSQPWPTRQQTKKEKPEEVLVLQEPQATEGSLPFNQMFTLPPAGAYESILLHVKNAENNIIIYELNNGKGCVFHKNCAKLD